MKTGTHDYKMASIGLKHLSDTLAPDELDNLNWVVSAYLNDEHITPKMAATVDRVADLATPGFAKIQAFAANAKAGDKTTITNNGLVFDVERQQGRTIYNITGKQQ